MTIISTLLQANLDRVFNERDAARRDQAIRELYAADATLYEQEGTHTGTEAITRAVSHLLGSLPPTLRFAPVAPAMENHDLGKLLWRGQLGDGAVVVTGTDIVRVVSGRIQSVHVFLDRP
jgi:hypothetical protein